MKPTIEQQNILATAKTGNNLVVNAGAGTGKTTTCTMLADALFKPSLYLCFNADIAKEAAGKFPSHVECKTAHSLAWRNIIGSTKSKMASKLDKGYLDATEVIKQKLPKQCKSEDIPLLNMAVCYLIKLHCQSANETTATTVYKYFAQVKEYINEVGITVDDLVVLTSIYWDDLVYSETNLKITHDVYLKMYQLTKPKLDVNVLYLDEAQDTTECVLDIVLNQLQYGTQVILVGDKYQSIYEWRGAINALEQVQKEFCNIIDKVPEVLPLVTLNLTESWRYTQQIADQANIVLRAMGSEIQLKGLAVTPKGMFSVSKDSEYFIHPSKAILVRNNTTLIQYLLQAVETLQPGQKVFVPKGVKDCFEQIWELNALKTGKKPFGGFKHFARFKTQLDFLKASETDINLKTLFKLYLQLCKGAGLYKNIKAIESIVSDKVVGTEYTISTGHKAKGLEWDIVEVSNDFAPYKLEEMGREDLWDWLYTNQNGNLLYVALTRAKYELRLAGNVGDLLEVLR